MSENRGTIIWAEKPGLVVAVTSQKELYPILSGKTDIAFVILHNRAGNRLGCNIDLCYGHMVCIYCFSLCGRYTALMCA